MVIKVKLEGLNVVRSRGRWYVYVRGTKEKLISGFKGSREDLLKRMTMPDFVATYNAKRVRDMKRTYQAGTLGSLVEWFENDCQEFAKLADATKDGYIKAFRYLRPAFDHRLEDLTQSDIYDIRDQAAKDKWPRFADLMVSALSSMFGQAVKRKKMPMNPALGIGKLHKASHSANREWREQEFDAAIAEAPTHIKTIMMIARYAGYRGQTIAALRWSDYQDDRSFGKCFRVVTQKNDESVWIPAAVELQDYLATLNRTSVHIATKANGTPWDNEVQMQTEVSHYFRKLEKAGKIGAKTTLHGLRVTYAADLRRGGADAGQVAAALGDKSERMGAHYTRHVENEAKVIQAFSGKMKRKNDPA